jgi:hypothetical protein
MEKNQATHREVLLARHCKALEGKLAHFQKLLRQKDDEILRLKRDVARLKRTRRAPGATEPAPDPEPGAAENAPAEETPPGECDPEKPAEPCREPGEPAAEEEPEPEPEPEEDENRILPVCDIFPEKERLLTVSFRIADRAHPAPGAFMNAVLDGEEDADEMRGLLQKLRATEDSREHRETLLRMSTLQRLMTQKMLTKRDPETLSRPKRLFIRHGMLDERLMQDRPNIWEALLREPETPGAHGVYYLDEWYSAIYHGEHPFSMVDELNVHGVRPDRSISGEKAVTYELHNAAQMHRMCAGPRGNAATILIRSFCNPGPENAVITREWIRQAMDYIRRCDPGLFMRRYRKDDVEVEPLFILFPGYGENGVTWEAFIPGQKGTTGPRICLCSFPRRNSLRTLLQALAGYRWEFARLDSRQYWMTEGLTGEWLSLFHGPEQKQDLKALFIQSYQQWIVKESQRMPVLETRFRNFFWQHVPFSGEIKKQLRGAGAYFQLFEKDALKKARDDAIEKEVAAAKKQREGPHR